MCYNNNVDYEISQLTFIINYDIISKSIIINSESADVTVEGINIENMEVELSSGDVKIDSSKIDACKVFTTSGEIAIDQLDAYSKKDNNTIQAESTSGDVKLYNCNAKTVDVTIPSI